MTTFSPEFIAEAMPQASLPPTSLIITPDYFMEVPGGY